MVVRNYKSNFWQYINWIQLINYIDSLKSRKYKTFIKKTDRQVYKSYWFFMFKPAVLIVLLKDSIDFAKLINYDFELGYLLFCFSNVINLDISFFYYYKNKKRLNFRPMINALVFNMRYLLITSFLEQHSAYLQHINSKSCIKFYYENISQVAQINSYINDFPYYLFVSLKNHINSIFLFAFLRRIFLSSNIFKAFDLLFTMDEINQYSKQFYLFKSYLFLQQNQLLKRILNILILHITYEVTVMLTSYSQNCNDKVISICNNNVLFFLCKDSRTLINLQLIIISLLAESEFLSRIDIVKPFALKSEGLSTKMFKVFTKWKIYPFHFIIQPSLSAQFILMKQLSWILYKFKSGSVFLLGIRLNMLFLLWLNIWLKQPVCKILYLMDYLASLKLKAIVNSNQCSPCLSIRLVQKLSSNYQRKNVHIFKNQYLSFFTIIYNKTYYQFYFAMKLLWIYKLQCHNNLREAL